MNGAIFMLYLKEANFEDVEKEYEFIKNTPKDENGFTNPYFDCTKDEMRKLDGVILKITAKVKDDNAEPLRANSTIQLTDIGISVEGKVISDMN